MDGVMFCVVLVLMVLINDSEAYTKISGSAMIVSRVTHLVCKSNVNLSLYRGRMVAYHQWNQVYDSKTDRFITNLPPIEAINTQLMIKLEKFDNNTDIYSSFSVYNASNGNQGVFNLTIYCSGVKGTWIKLLDDGFYEYDIDKILHYDLAEQATFSCQAYSDLSDDIQVGLIHASTNRIFIYKEIKSKLTLTAAHNGSMLCCIYYTVNDDKNGSKNIRRFVKDKTLLIQKEKVPSTVEPNGRTTESYCDNSNAPLISDDTCVISPNTNGRNSNSTNEKGKNFNATNEKGKNSNATNEKGKNSNAKNEKGINSNSHTANEKENKFNTTYKTDSSDHDAATTNNLTIIISSLSASVLVLLVVIYVVTKRCRRDTHRRERPQLPLPQIPSQRSPNEIDSNSPFYLNLLFRRECQLEIQAREEPQYEEIMYQ